MNKKLFLLVLVTFFASYTIAQTTVTGVVKHSNKAVDAVNVRLKGAINADAVTNADGSFSISIPENSSNVLIFSKDGFDDQEINVKDKTNISVNLVKTEKLNQYGQIVDRRKADVEMRNGILVFESKDQKFKYWFDTRVYIDGLYAFDKNTYNPIGNGVAIRRARFALKANLWGNWYGELDLDFAGAEMEVKDMYIKYTTDNGKTNIKLGNFKEGFSMESTTTSRYVSFIERSLVNEFAPSRHLGLNATTWGDYYTLIGGLHFQKVGELEEVEFSKDNNKDFGIDEGISFTTRLVGRPIAKDDFTVHLGFNASYRTPKTSWEKIDEFRISTRSMSNINRKKYLDTDDILGVTSRSILGGEFAAFYKNIMFQSEYMISKIYRTDAYETVDNNGFYVQAGYILFGGQYKYNKAEAEPTQIKRGRNWGDVELLARYDYLNLNDFAANVYGGSADGYTFGVNYHINSNVKFMLNYSYLNHDRYANGKGKLFVGHDVNGDLTKNYENVVEENGLAGENFGMIQVRFEIDF